MSGRIFKKTFIVAGVVVLLGVAIGWRFAQKKAQDARIGQVGGAGGRGGGRGGRGGGRGANVEVATSAPAVIENTLNVVGSVESPYNIRISPKTAGRINYLEVREGARVTAGQILVKIDPTEIQGQILADRAAIAEAQSRLAQAQITQAPTNVGIATTIEQQGANLASAQADYGQVTANYTATVAAAHSSVVDAQAKVAAAQSAVENAKASLNSAQANLRNALTKYTRTDTLYKQGFTAAQDVDDARTEVDVQRAAVNVAQGQVDAANSALKSAEAVRDSAMSNEKIVARQGLANIQASKAKVTQAKAQLTAAVSNRAQGPAYQANLAALRAAVVAAQGELSQAQARLADTDLRAPIDGIVTERSADPGSIASPGTSVLTIQSLNQLYVTGSVPVEDTRAVSIGTTVMFSVDAIPGKTFTAPVAELNPSADPLSRQFMIRLKLDNKSGELKPGMFARMNLVLEKVNAAVAVPREAVETDSNGEKSVFVVDDKKVAHQVKVTIGAEDAKYIEIKEGLQPGQQVVTLSYTPVKDGQTVTIGKPDAGGGKGGRRGKGGGGAQGSGVQGSGAQGSGDNAPTTDTTLGNQGIAPGSDKVKSNQPAPGSTRQPASGGGGGQ